MAILVWSPSYDATRDECLLALQHRTELHQKDAAPDGQVPSDAATPCGGTLGLGYGPSLPFEDDSDRVPITKRDLAWRRPRRGPR
jgi:hypothetical protein